MSDQRLPGLLTRMRRLLDTKEIDAAFVTLDQIEDEWDAITTRMADIAMQCGSLQMALDDLMDGEW